MLEDEILIRVFLLLDVGLSIATYAQFYFC